MYFCTGGIEHSNHNTREFPFNDHLSIHEHFNFYRTGTADLKPCTMGLLAGF
jgi:hypothetical protein